MADNATHPCGHATKHTSRVGCCASCRLLFSSDSAFDRHHKGGECKHPLDVGLVEPSRTAPGEVMWSLPGGYYAQDEDA